MLIRETKPFGLPYKNAKNQIFSKNLKIFKKFSAFPTVSTSHTGLEPIGTSTTQHFVDSGDVVRVGSNSQVKSVFTAHFGHVFVGTDSSGFQSFGSDLFVLIGYHYDVHWKGHDGGFLGTKIENSDLSIWNTSVESRFWVGFVFAISVASGWSASHVGEI